MAMKYTPIPHEFLEECGELSDAEYGRLIRWCQTYCITGEETELCGNERFFKAYCRNAMGWFVKRYEETCEKNRINGAKGGRPKTQKNPAEPSETQNNPAVSENNPTVTEKTQLKPKLKPKPKDKEYIESTDVDSTSESRRKSDFDKVRNTWNEMAETCGIAKISRITQDSTRAKLLNKRMEEYGLDDVLHAIDMIYSSDFLTGHGDRGWAINFDWFIKPNNFIKVLEGNYSNREGRKDTIYTFEQIAKELEKEAEDEQG